MTPATPLGAGPSNDLDRVAAFARARFGADARLERLAGDASDRTFFRLRAPSLSPLVLMVHAAPFELESLPFFLHARFLHEIGAAVPQIVASYPSEGILVVQDLGDESLQTHLERCDAQRRRFLYFQAVQLIAFLQQEGTRALTPDLPASRAALDRERLLFEMSFFREHYVQGLLGSPLTQDATLKLDAWLRALAEEVAGIRRVLCHRDFHSRNLMVKGERLYMVDFQDARMGPFTYDLASLARDSYVELPEDLVQEMVEFYRESARAPEETEEFHAAFDLTSLQRNIKAIGTFASQAVLRGNRGYLQYIAPTLGSVTRNLRRKGDEEILALFTGPLAWR